MAESSPNPSDNQSTDDPSAQSPDPQESSAADSSASPADGRAPAPTDSGTHGSADAEPSSDEVAEEALRAAGQSAREISDEAMGAVQGDAGGDNARGGQPLNLPEFSNGKAQEHASGELSLLNDINLNVTVELGRTRMYVEDVLRLNENSVVELEKAAGDPVDIFVNNRHVARGEVLVLNENFCVRISEIVKQPTDEE